MLWRSSTANVVHNPRFIGVTYFKHNVRSLADGDRLIRLASWGLRECHSSDGAAGSSASADYRGGHSKIMLTIANQAWCNEEEGKGSSQNLN
jgi:hypothetical protein